MQAASVVQLTSSGLRQRRKGGKGHLFGGQLPRQRAAMMPDNGKAAAKYWKAVRPYWKALGIGEGRTERNKHNKYRIAVPGAVCMPGIDREEGWGRCAWG